jgi:hypothetical protein
MNKSDKALLELDRRRLKGAEPDRTLFPVCFQSEKNVSYVWILSITNIKIFVI